MADWRQFVGFAFMAIINYGMTRGCKPNSTARPNRSAIERDSALHFREKRRKLLPVGFWIMRSVCKTRTPFLLAVLLCGAASAARADSVVVFNEIMYHPAANSAGGQWLELCNQMSVDVDISGWSVVGGVNYTFAEATVIPGGGYLVVAQSPSDLAAATGLTNILGPFTGQLPDFGYELELYNRNQRLMDSVSFGVGGAWPVGPDGSGVSLAKRDVDSGSGPASSWTVSAQVGGTPGARNFPAASFQVTNSTPVLLDSSWKYQATGLDLGSTWRQPGFDDSDWPVAPSPFQAGALPVLLGNPVPLPSVFNTGVGPDGAVLAPGSPDPHYWLTLSAQSTPPPPPIAATVVLNDPAWLANDTQSSWIGSVNPGTTNVAAGDYNYRTTFSLAGYDPATASLTMSVAADNQLTNVFLNGVSQPLITYVGYAALSGQFTVTNGFVAGTNTLDFFTVNDNGPGPNPAGFRAVLAGAASPAMTPGTTLADGLTDYYFRTTFNLAGAPQLASLQLQTALADGAVFYLNGTEVLRLNMPTGSITAATLALTNASSALYLGPFALPNSALVSGANVLAVEVHPAAAGSTNHIFFAAGLSLTVTNLLALPPAPLAFNEISPGTNGDFWVELMNYSSTNVDLGGCQLTLQGGETNNDYVFPAQTVAPFGFVQVTQAALGFGVAAGDRLFLYGPTGSNVLDAVIAPAVAQARWPDGLGAWGYPSALTPGASNSFVFHRDVVINEIMYHAPILPAMPAVYGTNIFISITNAWKYQALGVDLGSAWQALGYDDSAWPVASALFYNTPKVLPAPGNTALPLDADDGIPIITYYFRTPFLFPGPAGSAQLTLQPILDGGAVYYLNGTEIYRQNMPSGPIAYTNFSSQDVVAPGYSGPFTVPVTNLVGGTNLFAVEVHQWTTNAIATGMAFGAEVSAYSLLSAAQPAQESPEAWVELFNRGTNTVDLTAWTLGGGMGFAFAPGTLIPPGGYLVVANDVGLMQSNYPGIAVVGPATGKLAHEDSVILTDAAGNIANQVNYYNSGRWPSYPDGGGSSLELRNPWADNSVAEAWAASNETGRSYWSNYTYSAVAANILGPTLWNEFDMGLLDAGECLIDDIHVVQSPDTNPVEMLQNGSFENGLSAWRVLGDHGASQVEVDPDNPANHVLHLISTGPTDTMHNHLETTYTNGLQVTDGLTYQISFRAKWLAGNNQLNTRLYFNRVARTTPLLMPALHGTPGGPNSAFVTNIGPTFTSLSQNPVLPEPNTPVTVTVSAGDPQGVSGVGLWWAVNGGAWQITPMSLQGPAALPGYSNYVAVIAGQPAAAIVQFYAQATNALGVASTFPARGPDSRALFKVDDGTPIMPQLHRCRLLLTAADTALLHAPTNVMSNGRLGATVVYDERQVFYDVGIKLSGSERGRDDPTRVGFTLKLQPDQLFRGVQDAFTFSRDGDFSGIGGEHDELMVWHAANHAGGILSLEWDLLQLFAPQAAQNGPVRMRTADYNAEYFDNQYKNGSKGNLYDMEVIYYPLTTLTGDPQAPKLPQPDNVINIDFQNWGNSPEDYRWLFIQENNADADDYSQLIALNQAFSLAGAGDMTPLSQLLDTDEYLRTLALLAFCGDPDMYLEGLNHNWKVYFRPADGLALGLLWNEDYSWVLPLDTGFPGTGSPNTYQYIMSPNNYRRYYNHLLDLMTTTMNSDYLGPWAARYAGLLGQDWSRVVDYVQQRADYIRTFLPLTTPFAITSHGGAGFATTNGTVTLTGTAPLTVKTIEVNGVVCPLTWTSLTNWTLSVPVPAYSNTLAAQGFDNYSNLLAHAAASIVVTNLSAPALPIVINEWMADNAGPGGFADPVDGQFSDWFELYNPNNYPVNLSDYSLTDKPSEPAKWAIPTNTLIAARGFLLVWADKDPALNGLGTNGDLHANFKLAHTGTSIGIYGPDLAPMHTVTFGSQLQNVSQGLYPDGNTNAVYFMTNWTPRASNQLGQPPAPNLASLVVQADGAVSFQVQVTPNRTYGVQYTDQLNAPAWTPLGNQTASGPTLTVLDNLGGQPCRFYRLLLLQ
jgi:hypothetical protein